MAHEAPVVGSVTRGRSPSIGGELGWARDRIRAALDSVRPRDFAVRLWDGTTWPAEEGQPTRCTWVVTHPSALRSMLGSPSPLKLGEAYLRGDIDVEGDIGAAFRLCDQLVHLRLSAGQRLLRKIAGLRLPGRASSRGTPGVQPARPQGRLGSTRRLGQAIAYHYDLPIEFWQAWLDRRLLYSCAYFERPDDSIDTAQLAKVDYVCRKLDLRPGEEVLDMGCGWGAFLIHAAQRYGVTVRGLTLSRCQFDYVSRRIQEEGLAGRCTVELRDYRTLEEVARYDKICSVGSVEHVRREALRDYFALAHRLLRPGGLFLNHGITVNPAHEIRGPSFVHRYIFPDCSVVPVSRMLVEAEAEGFETRDVENLREHYARTCVHWLHRFEASREEIERVTSPAMYRLRRMHIAATGYYFETGASAIHQMLLRKIAPGERGEPGTRAVWYRSVSS